MMARAAFLHILIFLISVSAFAQNRCIEFFSGAGAGEEISWDFRHAEFEAKFLAQKGTFKALKDLVGKRLRVTLEDGSSVEYQVEFNKKHIYKDTYFDSKDLLLYERKGLLRQRQRWDKGAGDGDYKFKKVVFQAKSEDKGDKAHLNEAFMARDEIAGKEFKKKISKKKTRALLQTETSDEAVRFARELVDYDGKFRPVLRATQERYFMRLSPVLGESAEAPSFYLSLDDVAFDGLAGAGKKVDTQIVELETIEVLDKSDPALLKKQVQVSNSLASLLQSRFSLAPAPSDKYGWGIERAVLEK